MDKERFENQDTTVSDELDLERIMQETFTEDPDGYSVETSDETQLFTPQQADHPQHVDAATSEDDETDSDDETEESSPKKKGEVLWGLPHIFSTAVWVAIILFVGVTLGRTLWLCAADLLALGKTGQEITITVSESDDIGSVAEKLQENGMIRYPNLFKTFASLTGKGEKLLVGDITFDKNIVYDYNALINALAYRSSALVTVEVMIPEGYSCAQIFALLEEKGICDASVLEAYAAEGELNDYWFLEGIERGHKYCLEGFLFPDTYEFYMDDEPRRVIEKFLDDFDYRFTDRMMEKLVALRTRTGMDLTVYDVVIMASIVEREKAEDLEGYTISSVFYNRLTHSSSFPYLNSDATIQYAIDYYSKGELTTDALINASPFNTYTQRGLPPSPIANPGLSSLDAALAPDETNYYYFVLNKATNRHVFARTYEEHLANVDNMDN